MVLSACEPEPRGPVQVMAPEALHFETQWVRREVDFYKDAPTASAKRRVEQAFAKLDAKIQEMEAQATSATAQERLELERKIADLKRRRELHWTRAQTLFAETQPIQKAEPVGERRIQKAERAEQGSPNTAKRSTKAPRQRVQPQQQGVAPKIGQLFQRLFRR